MLNRRRVVQGGLALGSLTVAAPYVRAQGRAPVKVRYNEVVRSILYAPAYVALTKGYFKDAGLDITLATAQGGDKSVAALLSNSADIALIGPEMGNFKSGGLIYFNLYNDAVIVDRYGILPIQAYGELKNETWRFAELRDRLRHQLAHE